MSWDARQRAMLAEMGYRLPPPALAEPAPEDDAVETRARAPQPPTERAAPRAAEPVSAPAVERAPEPAPRRVDERPAARPVAAAEVLAQALPGREPLAGLATLDLEALRGAVPGCRACGLCEQRRQPVFGAGAVSAARWLVVTDPPDEADDAAGQPLVSEAGRLLDRMLAAVGERRGGETPGVFVTPLIKCRPARGRAPDAAELAACEPLLARQLALLQPQLVLAMGPLAARRLTGLAEPLGRLRGRVHQWQQTPLVVTYHPAYLLRSPADKAGAWDDLCLAHSILTR